MGIEYNECHYGGMYMYICKKKFVITEFVHMNAGVSSEKEKVKESQSQSRSVTSSPDFPIGFWVGGVTHRVQENLKRSSYEEVMTFRNWRSHVVKPSRDDLTLPS